MTSVTTARIILDWTELFKLRAEWKRQGLTVIFTNGVFDILHAGHLDYLLKARNLGDKLVVGVNTDASAKRLKKGKNRPIVEQDMRVYALSCLRPVDVVTLFDQDTPLELISNLMPDVLVKGDEYREDEIVGAKEVKSGGGRVFRAPMLEGVSTTAIIETIKKDC